MTEKELVELIKEDEKQTMEFKDGFIKVTELAECIMLFANADGGRIFLGIQEKPEIKPSGKIKKITKQNIDAVYRASKDCLVPPVPVEFEKVSCSTYNCEVLVINVPDSDVIHQHVNGKIQRRRGSERETIFVHKEKHRILGKSFIEYDKTPVNKYGMRNFGEEEIQLYLKKYLERNPSSTIGRTARKDWLKNTGAIVTEEGKEIATLTGLLFFGKNVSNILNQAQINFIHFAGTEVAEPKQKEAYLDSRELTGTIPNLISMTESLIHEKIAKRGVLGETFEREEVLEYPNFAIREAVINAICHRDYSLEGAVIQIRLFADRLEVQSPGSLPGHVTVDNIINESFARNPHIARILRDMGYVERQGIGIDNMVRSMIEANLEPPQFINTESSFIVVLKNHTLLDEESLNWLKQFGKYHLISNESKALVYIKKNGTIVNNTYQVLNFVDSVQATRELSAMVKKGVIEPHSTRGGAYYALSSELVPQVQKRGEPLSDFFKEEDFRNLNNTQIQIIRLVFENRKMSAKEIFTSLEVKDRRYFGRLLRSLTDAKFLIRHGKSLSDPKAYYMINEDYRKERPEQLHLKLE